MEKALIILQKEWRELTQQRGLMLSITLLPLLFTLIPVVIFAVARFADLKGVVSGVSTNASIIKLPALAGMNAAEATQAIAGMQYSLFYILLPLMLPSIIAAYSVVGEKTSRTLEPLLATPISTWQLLLGKSLAALLPAILVTWIGGCIFIAATALLALSAPVFAAVITPGWLITLFLWTPCLSLIAIAAMIAVSARVNDPRTAQQYSAWVVVPFMLLFFGQLFGLVTVGPLFTLTILLILVPLAALALWFATRIFQRETILTRWK